VSDHAASAMIDDGAQRRRALEIGASFVVQAPAGSGKTELLVRRFLALLAAAARPESVLAITFTRKAAGEMRERILTALRGATSQAPADAYERERYELARAVLSRSDEKGWHLLGSPSRLQVFTIDGLCSRIVGSMPLLSGVGRVPTVVEDASPLMREAVRRTLRSRSDDLFCESLAVLLERYEMGVDRLESQLMAMLERRDQWAAPALSAHHDSAAWVADVEQAFSRAVAAELAGIAATLPEAFAGRIHAVAARSRANLAPELCRWPGLGASNLLTTRPPDAEAWRQAADLLLTKDGDYRSPRGLNKSIDAGDKQLRSDFGDLLEALDSRPSPGREALSEALARVRKLPRSGEFSTPGRAALAAFVRVLLHAYAELLIVFRERGQVDYAEIAMRAAGALEYGETMEKIDARIEHLLVDEFQDTSVLQCELLKGLTSGWQPGDGRTLFLVGDPMQSIYRFRKAEVGLFLAAREPRGMFPDIELEALTLTVNFRSDHSVIDWVNSAFAKLFGGRDDADLGAVAYAAAQPSPRAGVGDPTRLLLWGDAPADGAPSPDGAECDAIEARGLAALIADELLPAARRRRGRVAVLVRARRHATPLLAELAQAAVRVKAPGLDRLCDRPLVRDLESLTRSILHPGDRLSQLAMLRGPWVGLGLDDLGALVEPSVAATPPRGAAPSVASLLRDAAALAALSDDGRARVARWREVHRRARSGLGCGSIDCVVRSAWLRLGGSLLADAAGALDAEAFFDLLAACAHHGQVDLEVLSQALARQEANVDPDPAIDVEILTMHKAKGLEFDTVVLPALTRGPGATAALPLAMETEPRTGALRMVAPSAARGRLDDDEDKHAFLAYREKRRAKEEDLRLLYVATTRAEHCLVLSGAAGRLTKNGEAPAASLLGAVAAAVLPAEACIVAAPAAAPRPPATPSRVTREAALHGIPARLQVRPVISRAPSVTTELAPILMATTKRAAHVGSVFHALAERITREGLDAWPPGRLASERDWIVRCLRAEGVLADEMKTSVEEVIEAATTLVTDERGRWTVDAHEEAHSEWALLALEGDTLTPAVIDRTFVDGDERWIVDFKTGRPDPDSGQYRGLDADGAAAAYVASHREAYARQLGRYRELLEHDTARLPFGKRCRRVRLGLFFVQLPAARRWVEIE